MFSSEGSHDIVLDRYFVCTFVKLVLFCQIISFEPPPLHVDFIRKMENAIVTSDCDILYPALIIPKRCTTLETSCELADNVFIDLNITSVDTEGNEMCIYNGFCNVKLIDKYDVNIQQLENNADVSAPVNFSENEAFLPEIGSQVTCPSYNQSHVWIDPVRSPHVYNSYDVTDNQGHSVCQTPAAHITVEHHNTYITQNVYNYKDSIQYSLPEDFEHKKFRKLPAPETTTVASQTSGDQANFYEEDEFECGVFLSHLPEEILNEKESKEREERKYIGLQSDNEALKQLMSTDIQSVSKQRKTILFLGHDSHRGQTIQKISVNDPTLVCSGGGEVDHEVVIDDSEQSNPHQKKYQCDKCKQIFDQISAFKKHMVGSHRSPSSSSCDTSCSSTNDVKFMCTECGKSLKNQEKFELHCMGHGDPELECNMCHKVFASKFTLRTHRKIHNRSYVCTYCYKSYSSFELLREHSAKKHFAFLCENCDIVTENYDELNLHEDIHKIQPYSKDVVLNDMLTEAIMEEDVMSDTDIITPSPEGHGMKFENEPSCSSQQEEIRKADSVIAKVMSNKLFLLHSKKARKHRRYNKACNVCYKVFDRVGDLKRHLIEHVIRSTLAKTPVSKEGALNIHCEICQAETFTKVDKYKAHLREHAKLTIYQCTFCDKSFSDSSNFSKHKKIHGTTYLQCDLCQRKFNSKKMITQHMEYHNKNSPLKCLYCTRVFHFQSMLNKHIKCAHIKELSNRFRCRFCHVYFKTLKEKWDHEWTIHNVRKMIVDCLICGAKFRKYSELKKHCFDEHDMEIPLAKKLLKKKRFK